MIATLPLAHATTAAIVRALTLATVHGLGEDAEKVGVILVALLAAIVVVGAPGRDDGRARAWAMLGALVLTPVLLVTDIWEDPQLRHLRDHHPALALGVVVAGAAVVGALAVLFRRRPAALAIIAILAVPFRLPISSDHTTSNLLIPLYMVAAAGALAYLVPRLWGRPATTQLPGAETAVNGTSSAIAPTPRPLRLRSSGHALRWRGTSPPEGPRWREKSPPEAPRRRGQLLWEALRRRDVATMVAVMEVLLMGSVVLYALQAMYSDDFTKALENMVFFYVPFALLYFQLRQIAWTRELIIVCFAVAVGLALVLSGVGFVEYERKQLFLNSPLIAANQFGNYFRVNSVFFDPNIYGRFLALVMIAVAAGAMWAARRRDVVIGGLVLVWLWCGLVTSFSQSSIAALLLGLAVLAAWRWDTRAVIYTTVALVAIGGVVLVTAPPSFHLGLNGDGASANSATDGRANLITGGLSLFEDRPIEGFGSGSFSDQYKAHGKAVTSTSTTDSHTIPVTIAAEQGLVGLVLYVALVAVALVVLFDGAGRSPPRIAIAACFAALILHTLVYADFLEDPTTWVLLAIGAALAIAGRRPGAISSPWADVTPAPESAPAAR